MKSENTTSSINKQQNNIAKKNNSSDEVIDLFELFAYLVRKWYVLLMVLMIGATLSNAFTFFCIPPKYESTAKLYVVSASGDSVVDLTDLNIGTSLTNDYKELLISYPVLDEVIRSLNLTMTYEDLTRLITLSNPTNTRVLSITVKTTDPQLSADIANTLAAVAQIYLPETMSTVKPNIAQVGRVPEKKCEPDYAKYTVIGGFLALMCAVAVYIVMFVRDDTVKTAQDIEKIFGMTPLTAMPDVREMSYRDHTAPKREKITSEKSSR